MKILVTGSSGMLGSDLCEILKESHEVIGVDLIEPKEEQYAPNKFCKANITDFCEVDDLFNKEKPDLILHAAAWTDVDGCQLDPAKAHNINVEGLYNIAVTLSGTNVPLLFISTDFVFGGERHTPYSEDDTPMPLSVYGMSKYKGEEVIKGVLSRYAIVRTSWLFGKNGKNFVDTIISKGRSEGKLRVVNDQVGSPTYTRDLSYALKALLDSFDFSKGETFHISNSSSCSWYEFALEIVSNLPDAEKIVVEPGTSAELDRPARRPVFSVLDTNKFQRLTGMHMRPWKEAVKDYIKEGNTAE